MSTESILVTGASGYIGSLIAKDFLHLGFEVLGLDVRPPQGARIDSSNYRFLEADVTRSETFPESVRTASVLVHCAALVHRRSADLSRSIYFRVNHEGTRNILLALDPTHLRRVVFLSTVSVYGQSKPGRIIEESTLPFPMDPYGESKLAAEKEVQSFCQKRRIPFTVFRLAPVYGAGFLLNIEKRVYLPKQVAFYKIGDGTQRISMCAVSNVVDAVSQSLKAGGGLDGVFNLKDGEDYSINEIIAVMRRINKHFHRPVLKIPRVLLESFMPGDLGRKAGREGHLVYQLSKIAVSAVYSGEKLLNAGIRLRGSLMSEMLSEDCP